MSKNKFVKHFFSEIFLGLTPFHHSSINYPLLLTIKIKFNFSKRDELEI